MTTYPTPRQTEVLRLVESSRNPLSLSDLATALGTSRASAQQLVRRSIARGMARRVGPDRVLVLTARGLRWVWVTR